MQIFDFNHAVYVSYPGIPARFSVRYKDFLSRESFLIGLEQSNNVTKIQKKIFEAI
jgi:hypothetical protein